MLSIILALLPLVGVWLGSRLTRGKEERQWRRNQCLEAYAELLNACELVALEADRYCFGIPAPEGRSQSTILLEKTAEMHRLASKARLLSSSETQDAIHTLVSHFGTVSERARSDPRPTDDEWRKLRAYDGAASFNQFMNAARVELGVDIGARRWMKMAEWAKRFNLDGD